MKPIGPLFVAMVAAAVAVFVGLVVFMRFGRGGSKVISVNDLNIDLDL